MSNRLFKIIAVLGILTFALAVRHYYKLPRDGETSLCGFLPEQRLPPANGSFSWAMDQAGHGKLVTRQVWSGEGQWIGLRAEGRDAPYLYLHNAQGKESPWTPAQGDVFSQDWRKF